MLYKQLRLPSENFYKIIVFIALILTGCNLRTPIEPKTPTSPPPTQAPLPYDDVSSVMYGICFEAAFDVAGQVFVIRDENELTRFYDNADNSDLCRRPIKREPFDFSSGRILFGLWDSGIGCTARHDILDFSRDDSAKTITVQVAFITEGDCTYELLRPLWLSVQDAADYEVILTSGQP